MAVTTATTWINDLLRTKGNNADPELEAEAEVASEAEDDAHRTSRKNSKSKTETSKQKGATRSKKKKPNWRTDARFCRPTNLRLESGAIVFSPGWFSLGHTASSLELLLL